MVKSCRLTAFASRMVALVASAIPLTMATSQPPKNGGTVGIVLVRSIGTIAGDSRFQFNKIDAVGVNDKDGIIFVLDQINARLSAFTHEGRFVAMTGPKDWGRGEFWFAYSLAASGSSVRIYDAGRIFTYALRGGAFVQRDEWRVPFEVSAMCILNEEIFALGYHQGSLVHRITPDHRVTVSFGRPFRDEDPLMAELAASGRIVCDPGSHSIFVASVLTPTVRRYTPSGELLWEKGIPGGFVRKTITRIPNGVKFSPPKNREHADMVVSLTVIPGSRLLLQYGEEPGGTAPTQNILHVQSVLYEINTGAVLAVRQDLPRIDFASGQFAYSRANDPFPKVKMYEWR